MKAKILQWWYRPTLHWFVLCLLPFSWIFGVMTAIRRGLYRRGIFVTHRFSVPVIVVGNITVGGTGKTPFVIELVKFLQSQGYRPGMVSRGYGGRLSSQPHFVKACDTADEIGDEAVLLAENLDCPFVIAKDRVAAVRKLLEKTQCNIVISDDGLQHYRLGRDIEIALVDGVRRFGNQCLLPAGPLREPVSRLEQVDFVIVNGAAETDAYSMSLVPEQLIAVSDPAINIKWTDFPREKVHAVAGIGHPERFFMTLKTGGFELIPHAFPDHHSYQEHELCFSEQLKVVMTEKDAVKCRAFANHQFWYLRVAAKMDVKFEKALVLALNSLEVNSSIALNTQ